MLIYCICVFCCWLSEEKAGREGRESRGEKKGKKDEGSREGRKIGPSGSALEGRRPAMRETLRCEKRRAIRSSRHAHASHHPVSSPLPARMSHGMDSLTASSPPECRAGTPDPKVSCRASPPSSPCATQAPRRPSRRPSLTGRPDTSWLRSPCRRPPAARP